MTYEIVEVEFLDPRAVALRRRMSDEMAELYGEARHSVGAEDIAPASVIACLLVLDGERPVGTASLRHLRDLVEVKRMYLLPETRGTGVGAELLARIEQRAAAVTDRVVLHTGERQRAAIALYGRHDYEPIAVYQPYDEVPESLCFAKDLGTPGRL